MILAVALLVLPGLPASPTAGAPTGLDDDGRESLEEVLRRTREKGEQVRTRLAPLVNGVIAALEALAPDAPNEERDALVEELVGFGREATPLMVGYLEPGDSTRSARLRARGVATALGRLPSEGITAELLALALRGSTDASTNAVLVLGHSSERERVAPILGELFENSPDSVRLAALQSLARLGGERGRTTLETALGDGSPAVVASALGALTQAASVELEPAVRALAAQPMAAQVGVELLSYYRAVPEEMDGEVARLLLEVAAHPDMRASDRLALLAGLPEFGLRWERSWKDCLEPLIAGGSEELVEEAQICLARLGSGNARRDVLRRYDQMVDADAAWYQAWSRRGDVLVRIGEYRSAARDYKKAIELHRGTKSSQRSLWIGLARAYCLDDSLRQAHQALTDSPLGETDLRALGVDPDFAALAEHPTYGKVLR